MERRWPPACCWQWLSPRRLLRNTATRTTLPIPQRETRHLKTSVSRARRDRTRGRRATSSSANNLRRETTLRRQELIRHLEPINSPDTRRRLVPIRLRRGARLHDRQRIQLSRRKDVPRHRRRGIPLRRNGRFRGRQPRISARFLSRTTRLHNNGKWRIHRRRRSNE